MCHVGAYSEIPKKEKEYRILLLSRLCPGNRSVLEITVIRDINSGVRDLEGRTPTQNLFKTQVGDNTGFDGFMPISLLGVLQITKIIQYHVHYKLFNYWVIIK